MRNQPAPAIRPADHHRHGERERQLDEQRDQHDEAVVDQRAREGRVADQIAVVLEPDEFFRPAVAVPVVEAVPGGLRHRQRDECGEEDQRRRQEHDDRRPAVEGRPPRGFDIGGRGRGFDVGRRCGQENEPSDRLGMDDPALVERRGSGTPLSSRLFSLLLLGRVLDRRCRRLGGRLAGRDRHRHVVDHASDRGTEILVEVVLVVGGRGEIGQPGA